MEMLVTGMKPLATYVRWLVRGECSLLMGEGAYEFVCVTDFGISQPSGRRFTVVHPIMQYTKHAGDGLQVGQLARS